MEQSDSVRNGCVVTDGCTVLLLASSTLVLLILTGLDVVVVTNFVLSSKFNLFVVVVLNFFPGEINVLTILACFTSFPAAFVSFSRISFEVSAFGLTNGLVVVSTFSAALTVGLLLFLSTVDTPSLVCCSCGHSVVDVFWGVLSARSEEG